MILSLRQLKFLEFVQEQHGEQKRKYTLEPYWTHPLEVANMVVKYDHTPVWEFPDGTTYRHAFLKYHNSWSKLMPVVEQICKTKMGDGVKFIDYHYLQTFGMKNEESGEFMVRFLGCSLFQSKDLIEATYLAVVDFIKHIKS